MTLIIILNASLSFGVIVMVVSPLVWAILTQHGDDPQHRPVAVAERQPLSPRGPTPLPHRFPPARPKFQGGHQRVAAARSITATRPQ